MPRLAVVSSYFPIRTQLYRGHSAYQTLRRMTSWMDIQVFCPLAAYPSFWRPRNFSYVWADPSYSPPDVPAHYIEYPALPLVSRPLNGAVCAHYMLPHLEPFRPDLILSYYVYPDGYAALSAGKRLGVPVILGAIGSDINRIPDWISAFLTRKALREASFVLTVSEHLRDQAVRLGASRSEREPFETAATARCFISPIVPKRGSGWAWTQNRKSSFLSVGSLPPRV